MLALIGCPALASLIVIGGQARLLFVIGQTAESARFTIRWHNSAIDQSLWTAVAKLLPETDRERWERETWEESRGERERAFWRSTISQIKCCNLLVRLSLHMPTENQWGSFTSCDQMSVFSFVCLVCFLSFFCSSSFLLTHRISSVSP